MISPPAWLESLFACVMRATWQASVLIALVAAAQCLLRRVLPAQWLYALWLLVFLRLALPYSFESPLSLFNYATFSSFRNAAILTATKAEELALPPHLVFREPPPSGVHRNAPEKGEALRLSPPLPQPPQHRAITHPITFASILRLLPFVWLLGVAALLLKILWANGRLATRMRRRLPLTDFSLLQLAKRCAGEAGLHQTPWILKAPEVLSPALFGFSVPRLLLPTNLIEEFTTEELRYVFLHEFCHVRRRDIALNWITAIVQTLHWFNPLVWLASAHIRSERELACDAQVLARLEGPEGRDYGRTIIRLLESFSRPARAPGLIGILEDRGQMKRRVRMISRFGKRSLRWRWAGLAFAVLLAVAAMTDARTQQKPTAPDEAGPPDTLALFRIVDGETDAPIAGARINANETTDRDGRGGIRATFPGTVLVRASGYVPRRIVIEGEESFERTLRMERAVTIGGLLRNEEGAPIADAQLQLDLPGIVSAGQILEASDAGGRWRFTEAPRGLDGLQIHLFHPDYAVTRYVAGNPPSGKFWKSIPVESLTSGQGVLVMKRGFEITGVVTDLKGVPIEGAVVTMGGTRFPEENSGLTNTDRNGRFEFRNATAAATALKIQCRGFIVERKSVDLSPGMPELHVILLHGQILRVRVVDRAGNPVVGAMLTSYDADLQEKTDAQGRVVWGSAPSRAFMAAVRARGFPEAHEAVEAGERENLITLRSFSEIRVTGRVIDAATGQPVPEFQVLVSTNRMGTIGTWQNYRPIAEGRSGSFGFALRDSFRPTGTVVQGGSDGDKVVRYVVGLKIKAEGYLPDTSQTVAIENGDASVEIALKPGEGVSGIVRFPGGEPVPGARVYLCGRVPVVMGSPDRPMGFVNSPETLTDRSGKFQFDPEPDVRALVVIHESGFAQIPADRFSVPLAVTLDPWARVEGTLRIGSRPGVGESISLDAYPHDQNRFALPVPLQTQTDSEGRFVFNRVPPGTLSLRQILGAKQVRSYRPLGNIEAHPGETVSVMVGGMGRPVIGRVVFESSAASTHPERLVGILRSVTQGQASLLLYPVDFDVDGYFRFEDIPAGIYLLKYFIPSRPDNTFSINVAVPEMPGGRSDNPLDLGTIRPR